MEVIQIAREIYNKQKLLSDMVKEIRTRGEESAQKEAEYQKKLAITLFGLKNGEEFELEGKKIKSPPATIMDQLAKGLCWQEKINMDKHKAYYKSILVGCSALEKQINALQSINKYLQEIT